RTAGSVAEGVDAGLRDARVVQVDQEHGDALVFAPFAGGPRGQEHEVTVTGEGAPHLLSGQHEVVPVAFRPQLDAGGIGPRLRLAQAEAELLFARDDLRQVRPFLLLRAV